MNKEIEVSLHRLAHVPATLMVVFSIGLAITLPVANGQVVAPVSQQKADRDPEHLADRIIVGVVSEEEFQNLKLDAAERLEVFKRIRDKRGWMMSDKQLKEVVESQLDSGRTVYATGSCNQFIEMENGSTYATYPVSRTNPNPGECGTDKDDIVLVYSTPRWPSTNADNLRNWSNLWWVRQVLSRCYGGKIAANGLCTSTTRACVGSCAKWLGNDLNYVYIWQRSSSW